MHLPSLVSRTILESSFCNVLSCVCGILPVQVYLATSVLMDSGDGDFRRAAAVAGEKLLAISNDGAAKAAVKQVGRRCIAGACSGAGVSTAVWRSCRQTMNAWTFLFKGAEGADHPQGQQQHQQGRGVGQQPAGHLHREVRDRV